MRDPLDTALWRLAEDFIRGTREAHETVDRWIDAALTPDFRAIQSDWEDVRQEVRVRLYRNLSRARFEGRSSLRTYVHRVARNVGIDFLRQAHRRRETGNAENLAARRTVQSGGAGRIDSRDLLDKILQPFSPEDRLTIALVFEEHCTMAEVAARLGIPAGTVKSRVSRLKDKILRRRRQLFAEGSDDV